MRTIEIATESSGQLLPRGVHLQDSWILAWDYDPRIQQFKLTLELSLWPDSPYYEEPKPDEWTYYANGGILFTNVQRIEGFKEQASVPPSVNPDGSKDWGSVDALQRTTHGFQLEFTYCSFLIICPSTDVSCYLD